MKSEWRKVNLGDVCDLIPGFAFKSKDFGSYPTKVVKIGDIQPPRVAIDCLEGVNLSSYSPNRLEKYLVTKGDFVLAMTGATIGKLGRILADKPAYINQRVLRFKPKENVDWNFIYYVVNTKDFSGFVYNHIDSETAQPNISAGTLATFSFSIPPLPIQRKIASILSALDDKIETNNTICRNLEEQAIALYKSRLIDSIPFERIEDSHEKTTGWRIGTVDDVVEFLDSRRVPLSKSQREKMEKKYPYYGATELMDYVDNYLFDGTFLLLGEDGTVQDENGYPILQYVWGKFWVNNHAHVLTGKGKWSIELLYLLFANTKVSSVVTGAVQPKISQNRLKTVPVVIPPNPILENLSALITPLFAKRRQLSDENHRLASMRDALIPKIMCGEIDLSTII